MGQSSEFTIIYLHGFQSSSRSQKALALKNFLDGQESPGRVNLVSPNLPFSPTETLEIIEELLQSYSAPVLMGSSMGGFYAAWCSQRFSRPAVLVNPVADARFLFQDILGQHLENIYTSERYHFEQKDLDVLINMAEQELLRKELLYVLLETGDEVLDYRQALKKYKICKHKVIEGGDHRFQSFENCLPEIMAFYQEALAF